MSGAVDVSGFEAWYDQYRIDDRNGCLDARGLAAQAAELTRRYDLCKREMDVRVADHEVLDKLVAAEVISPKDDLPNISSGETAGLVRRIARNVVQNTPNVEVICPFDDDGVKGIFVRHVLLSKVIGTDRYSNDMQQNLFASAKTSLAHGFACVLPVLLQDSAGEWSMKYDAIHYRDVFPDAAAKDVRDADEVFVRRYLTRGEIRQLIRDRTPGWDEAALRMLLNSPEQNREQVDHQTKKRGLVPRGYEVITWYSNSGEPFLTFHATTKALLRIEKNKHPLKQHPVHFLVLEKDDQQPLGVSQVEQLVGRQDFQDLMLNGAMKLWYRNINPSIIGYGTVNSVPNLSPGKYTQIANPNAKIEPFEVNTQTLMQFGSISQQNLGAMVSMIGAADQQMATQAGNGMSATPQGVEAQQQMVDITTNNYQKAIESFFSHYCSYALTMYFQELKAVKKITPSAEARLRLLKAGLDPQELNEDGTLDIDFSELAVEYFVRCVPGSLVELEDEKQVRILNELFVPLSQAMPALAATGDQQILAQAAKAMQFIIVKQIELSGASDATSIAELLEGKGPMVDEREARIAALEERLNNMHPVIEADQGLHADAIVQMQQQLSLLTQSQQLLMEKLGVLPQASADEANSSGGTVSAIA